MVFETGQLSLHPGPDGEMSVARWTAPADWSGICRYSRPVFSRRFRHHASRYLQEWQLGFAPLECVGFRGLHSFRANCSRRHNRLRRLRWLLVWQYSVGGDDHCRPRTLHPCPPRHRSYQPTRIRLAKAGKVEQRVFNKPSWWLWDRIVLRPMSASVE